MTDTMIDLPGVIAENDFALALSDILTSHRRHCALAAWKGTPSTGTRALSAALKNRRRCARMARVRGVIVLIPSSFANAATARNLKDLLGDQNPAKLI